MFVLSGCVVRDWLRLAEFGPKFSEEGEDGTWERKWDVDAPCSICSDNGRMHKTPPTAMTRMHSSVGKQ